MSLTICCVSDTHGKHSQLDLSKYPADVLIHAGDFCNRGTAEETIAFLEWLQYQPYEHKLLIAGNHDWFAEKEPEKFAELLKSYPSITYLYNNGCEIDGVKFWGSADTPEFCNWAFNKTPEELETTWSKVPKDTDVILSHGPPHNILDKVTNNWSPTQNVGDPALTKIASNLTLKACIFGHIHTQGGKQLIIDNCLYVNAAVLNDGYMLTNKPQIITITV